MPEFKLATKSSWNSSKKKGRNHEQRATTQKISQHKNKQNGTKRQKGRTQSKSDRKSSDVTGNSGTLKAPDFKRNDRQRKPGKEMSRRQARDERRNKLKARSQYMTKEEQEAPKSFIVTRGKVTEKCQQLREDLRTIFSPYTATKLKERKKGSLQDYVEAASDFGVTHLMTLSQSDTAGTMLRMIRLPQGPTFWFRVSEYSLLQDVLKLHKHGMNYKDSLHFAPLVILNGFSSQNSSSSWSSSDASGQSVNTPNAVHRSLLAAMLKHMFPPMNVATMRLNNCRRAVFFQYNASDHSIDLRHYKIKVAPIGIPRPLKKLMRNSNKKGKNRVSGGIPDLGRFEDISDFVQGKGAATGAVGQEDGGNYSSDSEAEDTEATRVILAQTVTHNAREYGVTGLTQAGQKTAVRLKEIGPRMRLELVKIEELVNDGRVLYHRMIKKSEQEIEVMEREKRLQRDQKLERKRIQEENVKRKEIEKQEKEKKKAENRKDRQISAMLKKFEENDENDENDDVKMKQNENENSAEDGSKQNTKKKRKRKERDENDEHEMISFKRGEDGMGPPPAKKQKKSKASKTNKGSKGSKERKGSKNKQNKS